MSINIGSKRLKLDYKFNIRKKYFWLIEAKTGKDKEITRENIAQAYLYSLHPDINCRFLQYVMVGILTYMIEIFGYLRMLIQIFLLPYCKLNMKS